MARSLVDHHLDSPAYYTDADLVLALDHKTRLNSDDLLKLMQVRRAQRYRRLKRLKAYGLIDQRQNPYSMPGKRRSTIVVLTDLGKRVAVILKRHDSMKNWRFKIPARYIEKEVPVPTIVVSDKPTRKSIYDILDEDDSQYLDDEDSDDTTDEDFDDDAKFEMEDFLKELKRTTKDD